MRGASLIGVAVALVGAGCAPAHREAAAPTRLYFAVELVRDGRTIGKPKLLGEAGTRLRAERRQPGASLLDYGLTLMPELQGDRYRVGLQLDIPELSVKSELGLLHGEMRRLELGRHPGDLTISLTLMEVDSPEFRALMNLADDRMAVTQGSI